MKKKLLLFVLCGVLILGLTGCGENGGGASSGNVAVIVDNEGNTVKMSAKELVEVYDGNEAKFKKYYTGADITLTGTVESIEQKSETPTIDGKITFVDIYWIHLEEGWQVRVNKEGNEDFIAELDKGTKIEIKSDIAMGWNSELAVFTVQRCEDNKACDNGMGWPVYEYLKNDTTIKIAK